MMNLTDSTSACLENEDNEIAVTRTDNYLDLTTYVLDTA